MLRTVVRAIGGRAGAAVLRRARPAGAGGGNDAAAPLGRSWRGRRHVFDMESVLPLRCSLLPLSDRGTCCSVLFRRRQRRVVGRAVLADLGTAYSTACGTAPGWRRCGRYADYAVSAAELLGRAVQSRVTADGATPLSAAGAGWAPRSWPCRLTGRIPEVASYRGRPCSSALTRRCTPGF